MRLGKLLRFMKRAAGAGYNAAVISTCVCSNKLKMIIVFYGNNVGTPQLAIVWGEPGDKYSSGIKQKHTLSIQKWQVRLA